MNSKTFFRYVVLCVFALLSGSAAVARAQTIQPVPPVAGGTIPPGLVNCTAEALNISGFVGTDGRVIMYNLPATGAPIVVYVTCQDEATGATVTGQSAPFTPSSATSVNIGTINFGSTTPLANTLTVSPPIGRLTVGATEQLEVTANYSEAPPADAGTGDMTAGANGTSYKTSNPAVATISADGLVSAVGAGSATIYAANQGASGFATVTVISATLNSISATPQSVTIGVQTLFPAPPVQLQVAGNLANGTTIDLTPSSSGVVYSSSDPSVAAVSSEGLIYAVGACAELPVVFGTAALPACPFITITDTVTQKTTTVPVTVTSFTPSAIAAYPLPGSSRGACNVDLDGTLAYVANGNGGLQIIDVSTGPTAGALVGSLTFGTATPIDVKERGGLAAVALGTGGVSLVDVSNPSVAHQVALIAPPGIAQAPVGAQGLWLSDNTLYIASDVGFFTYDVSVPSAPVARDTCSGLGAWAVSGDATRGLAVLLTTNFSFAVMQAGSCTPVNSPLLSFATLSTPPGEGLINGVPSRNFYNLVLYGTSAYVALGAGGVQLVDLTQPSSPALRGNALATEQALYTTLPGTPVLEARGVAVRSTPQGVLVAVADDALFNTVPLFNASLSSVDNLNACCEAGVAGCPSTACSFPFPADCVPGGVDGGAGPPCNMPVQPDPNGYSIALGDGFGVQCAGGDANGGEAQITMLQVFSTQPAANTTVPPAVWITSPLEGAPALGNNTVVVTAMATSPVGIKSVQIFDGATPVATTQTSPFTATFVPAGTGALSITASATDTGGTTTFSAPVHVSVSAAGSGHSLAAGNFFTCDIVGPSDMKCWGDNSLGQLGNLSTATSQLRPALVDNPGDATSLDAGGDHSCVLDGTGEVKCWGYNNHGQLGNGSTTNSSVPVFVSGIKDAIAVGVGDFHSCVIHASGGTVSCWGDNGNGQLGNGATTDSSTPVSVSGLSNAVSIVAGQSHTCALLSSGQVSCWGYNGFGQLGNGTYTDSAVPVVIPNLVGVVQITAGEIHGCALQKQGTVLCWGNDGNGELGNGSTGSTFNSPQPVSGISTATEIAFGGYHACARLSGTGPSTQGPVVCWGFNGNGMLGNGTTTDSNVPVPVTGITDAVQLGLGLYHSCAMTITSGPVCWGYNLVGQLGDGTTTDRDVPVPVQFTY